MNCQRIRTTWARLQETLVTRRYARIDHIRCVRLKYLCIAPTLGEHVQKGRRLSPEEWFTLPNTGRNNTSYRAV